MVNIMLGAFAGGLAGGGAGWVGRHLLGALRRGVRPPSCWCEAGLAVLWSVVGARVVSGASPPWWAALPLLLGWLTVLLSVCDVLAGRLPDALTLSAYPLAALLLGLAAYLDASPALLSGAVLGCALYGGVYGLIRWLAPRALGPGDVKLAGSMGAFAGSVSISAVVLCMLAAALLTLLVALRLRGGIPHGPAMLAPVWLVTTFAQ